MKKILVFLLVLVSANGLFAQSGILSGNLLDDKKKALEGASVELIPFRDSLLKKGTLSSKTGEFSFSNIEFGFYKLRVSFVGMQVLTLDSIHFRTERYDFNITDITLKPKASENLDEVVIYAEKPLVQSKDGNITYNAGESALAAGSTASELLTQVPLVAKDADGKVTVRGKEPKILIDDKPVELNMQQLQDLLESMPGSSVEKIEVMTNPPPQYANEQGGVINIVTRKGKVGKSGRIALSGGTRGEASINGSYNYRKQGLAFSLIAGFGYNRFAGNGYSVRNNIYTDSSNFFNTTNNYTNKSNRPNFRFNLDYDLNKSHAINLVLQFNQGSTRNDNMTEYRNINRFSTLWKLSQRTVGSEGNSLNPSGSFSYTWKGKPGETLKLIASYNYSHNRNDRDFFQQYFYPDFTPNGIDSTQRQENTTNVNGYTLRVNYDKMLDNKKTFLSMGGVYGRNNNHAVIDASYKKKPEGTMEKLALLSNDFWFHQTVSNLRASVKQVLGTNFSFTAGTSAERTDIWFELLKEGRDVRNDYLTWLPFANLNKNWKEKLNLTFAYRRTIRRPGIGELNPTIDFSDPYNIRFGNSELEASTSDNFDLIFGRTQPKYFVNLSFGYNIVKDVFSQVRTLLDDGKTQVTWENISGRKEYEVSSWNGVTISKKLKLNFSASYTHNRYSAFDKTVRKFRDGGSFTSTLGYNYIPNDKWGINGSFNLNRFASPQGFARWNTSMNMGIQRKFFQKQLLVSVNTIDPFVNQQRRTFTYGPNFNLESYSLTQTRNYRLTVAWMFSNAPKKPQKKPAAKMPVKK